MKRFTVILAALALALVASGTAQARQDDIDALLTSKLAENWSVARLDKTMLQILRAGTYELLARADVPTGAAISEYVDVAHAFFAFGCHEIAGRFIDHLGDVVEARHEKIKYVAQAGGGVAYTMCQVKPSLFCFYRGRSKAILCFIHGVISF